MFGMIAEKRRRLWKSRPPWLEEEADLKDASGPFLNRRSTNTRQQTHRTRRHFPARASSDFYRYGGLDDQDCLRSDASPPLDHSPAMARSDFVVEYAKNRLGMNSHQDGA